MSSLILGSGLIFSFFWIVVVIAIPVLVIYGIIKLIQGYHRPPAATLPGATPMPKDTTAVRDFLLNLSEFILLYLATSTALVVIFNTAEAALGQITDSWRVASNASDVRMSAAILVVVYPILLVLTYFGQRLFRKDPTIYKRVIRRGLTFVTLFISAASAVITLISLVYNFFNGEITELFLVKLFAVIVISLLVFCYYLWDMRREPGESRVPLVVGVLGLVLVCGSVVWGILTVGTPSSKRAATRDTERMEAIYELKDGVISYWQDHRAMPKKIEDVEDFLGEDYLDPQTKDHYVLMVSGATDFSICANFEVEDKESWEDYRHRKGVDCVEGSVPSNIAIETYRYDRGSFSHYKGTSKDVWNEQNASGQVVFTFVETMRNSAYIYIFDSSRNFTIHIPVNGGMSELSTDGGITWRGLYYVTKDEINPAYY